MRGPVGIDGSHGVSGYFRRPEVTDVVYGTIPWLQATLNQCGKVGLKEDQGIDGATQVIKIQWGY